MACEYKIVQRVEFADTDMAGIMHFANFFRMMEATEHAFFRSLGASVHSSAEGGTVGWPRVHAACDYARPLRFEDEVEIHLLIAEIRTRSIRYQFVFRKLGELAVVARGTFAVVCASLTASTGKLAAIPIPSALREQLTVAPAELLSPAAPERS